MRSWLNLFIISSICLGSRQLYAQSSVIRSPNQYQAEAGTYLSTSGQTPFWLRANQYGSVPYYTPSATLRAGLSSEYDTSRHGFDLGYGVDVIANGVNYSANLPPTSPVILQQAYVKARLGIFEAYAGRRREIFGLVDTLLTSGAYSWSGNALPVPKIQISIPRFTPIKFTKGWVAVMGTFAHGWLGNAPYVQHAFLHQKSLFFRLGKTRSTFRAYGGINHDVVWGGISPQLAAIGVITSEQLPASFQDYLLVVTGLRTGSQSVFTPSPGLTDFDLTNRIGNHLGSVDLALEIDLRRHSLFIYRQNPYDSGALFYLTSIADGLNGIRLRSNDPNALVRTVLFEFLNTANQGGSVFVIDDPSQRGRVNYFNNAQFRDGWAYQRITIGTPFINPYYDRAGNTSFGGYTNNNRVYAWHLAAAGLIPWRGQLLRKGLSYQTKLSVSRNLGTYDTPFPTPLTQVSLFAQLSAKIAAESGFGQFFDGTELISRVAYDTGGLYPDTFGLYIGVRRQWNR